MSSAKVHPYLVSFGALSAPVFDHTRGIVLAVTAIGPAGSFDPALDAPLAQQIHACTDEVLLRLGHLPDKPA